MPRYKNIILVGSMGAGKSTVGKLLAAELGHDFYDCDREIENAVGVDIPTIFEFEGESGFRNREQKILEVLCAKQDIVLATGGGAVLSKTNRQLLRANGTVIYLQIDVESQLERTLQDKRRPLLQTDDPRSVLERLAAERGPLYESVADITFPTSGKNPRVVATSLLELLPSQ